MTKGKANGSKAGAGAKNTNKFVFTALSPKKDPWANLEEGGEDVDAGPICEREQHDEVKKKRTIPTKRTTRSSQKQKELDQPSKKRQKRSLDEENSLGTIFGLM